MGISGNGKTTLSRRLAAQLDVPYVELDAIYHQPGWTELSLDEFRARVDEATRGDGWVVDGSYRRFVGDIVLGRAETLVWLDQPLALVLWRLSRRAVRDIRTAARPLQRQPPDLALRVLPAGRAGSVRGLAALQAAARMARVLVTFPHLEVVRLRSPGEVARWLDAQGTRVR